MTEHLRITGGEGRGARGEALATRHASLLALCLALVLLVPEAGFAATAPAAKSEAVKTEATAAELPPLPRSEFIDDPATTKDPFFPNSTRRVPLRPVVKDSTAPAPVAKSLSAGLALKGITGSRSKPIALINNQTCAVGDTVQVKVPGGEVTLRCVEIREDSVVVTVEGEPGQKELSLPAP